LFHNSNVFGSCFIHILYTGCAKIKKNNSGAKRLNSSVSGGLRIDKFPLRLATVRSRVSVLAIVILRGPHMVYIPSHKTKFTCNENISKISSKYSPTSRKCDTSH